MEILFWVIELIVSYTEAAIAFKVMDLVFEQKEFKSKLLNPMLCALYLTILINFQNLFSLLFSYFAMGMTLLLFALVISFRYYTNFFRALSIVSCYFLCVSFLDSLAIAIIGTVKGDSAYGYILLSIGINRLIFICLLKLVLISVYFVIKYISDKLGGIKLSSRHYSGLLCIGVAGHYILYLSYTNTFMNLSTSILIDWLSLMFALIISILLVYIYIKYKETINEKKISELHSQLLKDKYENINQLYKQRSREFHDFKNHLLRLHDLVNRDEKEKTLDYILDLTEAQVKITKNDWSGNEIIDFILDTKYNECSKYDIEFEVDADLAEITTIKDKDMCNIFGNLLDNAIEACQKITIPGNRYIKMTLKTVNNIFLIEIKNSINQRPYEKNGKLVTTKANKLLHGLGLESVQITVDKYNGYLEYNISDEEFVICITIYF